MKPHIRKMPVTGYHTVFRVYPYRGAWDYSVIRISGVACAIFDSSIKALSYEMKRMLPLKQGK